MDRKPGGKTTKRGPIPPVTEKFFRALENALAGGQTTNFQTWKALTMDQWRAELRLQGLLDKEPHQTENQYYARKP